MTSRRRLRALEFALWVATVAALLVVGLALPSFVLGDGLLTLKYALFVVGFVLFGVGSFGIQPVRPHKEEKLISADTETEYGFEERIQQVPPLNERPLSLDERVSRNVKLFVVSLVVLGFSYLLEVGLNVRA